MNVSVYMTCSLCIHYTTCILYLHIYALLFTLVNTLKRVWKNLREAYYKCINNRSKLTRSGAKASKLPTCHFYEVLQFLSVTSEEETLPVACNITEGNITPFACSSTPKSTKCANNTSQSDIEPIDRKAFNPRKRKTNHNQVDETDLVLIKSLENVNNQIQQSREKDEKESSNFLFCKSLIEIMDTLSPEQNMEARIKMQQILFEIKYKK